MAFSFDGLGDGFASLSQVLDVALAASTIGGQLPLVGEDLAELASGLLRPQDLPRQPRCRC